MSARPDLSIVVVTYNSWADVEACLRSVARDADPPEAEVFVVDNASTDGTPDRVREAFPFVKVMDLGENRGFSYANNRAIAESSGRHVVLLNPDTVVTDGALRGLVRFLDETPGAGVVAPRLRYPDGRDQRTARSFPTPAAAVFGRRSPLSRLFPRNRWSVRYMAGSERLDTEAFEVDWVSGACLVVARPVIDRVGPLDEGYFMHWEDADWCYRIKAAGYGVWCDPRGTVFHAEGTSRGGWPPAQVRHFHRSAARYWNRHHARSAPTRAMVATALSLRGESVVAWNLARSWCRAQSRDLRQKDD